MRRLLPLLLALATVRCATVTLGRYQTVPVDSSPSGAAVRVACGSDVRDAGVTPVKVELRRKSETCALTLTKEATRRRPSASAEGDRPWFTPMWFRSR